MPSRQGLIDRARTFLDTPWRHQGRSEHGVDCLGLIVLVARLEGFQVADDTSYARRPKGRQMLDGFEAHAERVSLADKQPGDVVLFSRQSLPVHVGLLGWQHKSLSLIHAIETYAKVVEHHYDDQWRVDTRYCFRFPGVEPWRF